MEGPLLSFFNANAAIQLWWTDCFTSRRVNQNPKKEYRPRATSSSDSPQEQSTQVWRTIPLLSVLEMTGLTRTLNQMRINLYSNMCCVDVHDMFYYMYHAFVLSLPLSVRPK